MKPRIWFANGHWVCNVYGVGWNEYHVGGGRTPIAAYNEWRRRSGTL